MRFCCAVLIGCGRLLLVPLFLPFALIVTLAAIGGDSRLLDKEVLDRLTMTKYLSE